MSLLYSPPMIRRLCAVLRPASDIFASTSSRADKPQKQIRRKGHLQVRRAVLSSGSISSILPATKTSHSGPQGRHARHKATPAHSTRSKPGYCYLLRARDSTAQRDLSTSHQAHIFFCTPLRLCSLMFLKPLQELIVARGASRDRIDSRFPSLAFPP